MTAICVRRRILQYAPTSSKDDDQKEINPVGTLAGNATFAPPLKTPGDRKMRRKNWMTSRAENVGSSLEEEKTVNGREGEAEAAEAAEAEEAGGGGERKPVGEAIVKELSEEGLAHPPDGDEGYAEDEGCVQDEEQDTGAVLHLQTNLPKRFCPGRQLISASDGLKLDQKWLHIRVKSCRVALLYSARR